MSSHDFLRGRSIVLSISDSPDLPELGLNEQHLRDVAIELARYLLSAGAHLIYGGDLRADGYTEVLAEVATRHSKLERESAAVITNYLPWPTYLNFGSEGLNSRTEDLGEFARLIPLGIDGSDNRTFITPAETPPSANDRERALTAMRMRTTREAFARIALGGAVTGYLGRMPGVAEEVLLSLEQGKPVYLAGGFGGCVGDIAAELNISEATHLKPEWAAQRFFSRFDVAALNNALEIPENQRLGKTVHSDEIVALVLRGLRRRVAAIPD